MEQTHCEYIAVAALDCRELHRRILPVMNPDQMNEECFHHNGARTVMAQAPLEAAVKLL